MSADAALLVLCACLRELQAEWQRFLGLRQGSRHRA